jgi:branched-chain amino acid transport system permease protein
VTLLADYLVAGISTGCAFALVATGFVVIHRVTGVVNFAQGTFVVVGGLVGYSLLSNGVPHVAAEGLAVVVSGLVGLAVGLVAIGRRGTPVLASLIITLGLAILGYAVEIVIWGDLPLSYDGVRGVVTVAGVSVQGQYLLIIVTALVAFAALVAFFGATYLGKALTACFSNPYAARLMGINVTRMGLIAFGLGGALGGLAGVLITPLRSVTFDTDVGIAINGFAAAIFGGLVRPGAALAGGLVLGTTEALVAGYYRASYQSGIALAVMLALMVWQARRRAGEEA